MDPSPLLLLATTALSVLAALLLGAGLLRWRHRALQSERTLLAQLDEAKRARRNEDQLLEAVKSLTSESFREHSREFLELASDKHNQIESSAMARWDSQGQLLANKLDEYSQRLAELEKARRSDAGSLQQAIETLSRQSHAVRSEAANLAGALRDNKVRGLWGEMQLRRVLEESGMTAHVDFVEQLAVSDSSRSARPDVVVSLPNGRSVVVDAKAPLAEFLKASDQSDPALRSAHTTAHANALAAHVKALSKRSYTELVDGCVDFVVLFVPGDAFLTAALDARPELLEEAFARDVVLASPSTLLAFLRGVAAGWQERQITEQSQEIAAVGRELHERLAVFLEHFSAVGGSLDKAVTNYNQALGSMESRLLVSARRLEQLGATSGRALPDAPLLEDLVRRSDALAADDPNRAA